MSDYMSKEEFAKVEAKLNTLGIRSRTFILRKPRKTFYILADLSKKWKNCTEDEKDLIVKIFLNKGENND